MKTSIFWCTIKAWKVHWHDSGFKFFRFVYTEWMYDDHVIGRIGVALDIVVLVVTATAPLTTATTRIVITRALLSLLSP